jgi:ABC-type nickel/cobalt efflux system permease component RcnA
MLCVINVVRAVNIQCVYLNAHTQFLTKNMYTLKYTRTLSLSHTHKHTHTHKHKHTHTHSHTYTPEAQAVCLGLQQVEDFLVVNLEEAAR